ncbi:Transcription factor IIA, alpha/beta subunit [Cynara cardunculus var. scolymus]|uniref:Transcription factor IIA, alpha/beta subunit n=1 Tax=Cynara cardunculus var. scolymus TaxID=59895 RepID=A0A103Y6W5_CYNCS|nr:Transcription factor IIA, alpha/beta subunit [Cynara cardunculus var. scolymus]
MASSTTSSVYIQVIEDVINKVREEFINNGGPGEGVLNELQGLWELKMMQAGAIVGPIDRSSVAKSMVPGAASNTVHDLNVPYEGPDEYETPTADLLFPPTPLQTPMQTPLPAQTPLPGTAPTPLPGTVDNSYNIPTGGTPITPSDYSSLNENGASDGKAGRPSTYMATYVEGREDADRAAANQPTTQDFFLLSAGKRKRDDFPSQYRPGGYIPQQDGAADVIADKFELGQGSSSQPGIIVADKGKPGIGLALPSRIPQLDGPIPDPYDDALSTPNLQAPTPALVTQNDVLDDDEDEPLNENDDDDDLDDVDQGEELNTQHLVLAQFDKVTRAKSRPLESSTSDYGRKTENLAEVSSA